MDQDAEPNPYAAPRAEAPSPADSADYRRERGLLLVRNGAVLPQRCILTNEPLGPDDWTGQGKLQWTPPEFWFLLIIPLAIWTGGVFFADVVICFLIGLGVALLIAVLAALISKKMVFTYHLNRATRQHLTRLTRRGFSTAVLGGIALLVSILVLEPPLAKHGATAGGLVLIAGLSMLGKTTLLTLRRYEDGWFALEGCCTEFLDSL